MPGRLRDAVAAAATVPEDLLRGARHLSRNLASLTRDEYARFLVLAGLIGLAAALAVSAFYAVIDLVQGLTLGWADASPLTEALVIPLLVGGGLVASQVLVRFGARDSSGENVPDVMYRTNLRGGAVPGGPVLAKSIAAAVLIGSGGSVGAEGPVIVGGAAVASRIGRWLAASPHRLRTLVGCGAAAGLSAAFNAPIAGVLFGIEKILGAAGGVSLGPFVVASIVAATASRAVFGNQPVLAVPLEYGLRSVWELALYGLLGVAAGIGAVVYSRLVWRVHDWVNARSRGVAILTGALVVGGLDVVFRADLWGHGHQSVNLSALVDRSAPFLLGLFAAKLVATSFTLAVGRAGGVFTPALFLGAALGTVFGKVAGTLSGVPETLAAGAFGLAGMAALVAGATHAPLTAIMMAFEMTGDYALILPIMLSSTLAYVFARRLHPESIYTEWLVRRGIVLSHGTDAVVLARSAVAECLVRDVATVSVDASLPEITEVMRAAPQTSYPVVTAERRLVGMLNTDQVHAAAANGATSGLVPTARELMHPDPAQVVPDDTLLTALRRMAALDVDVLPVVDREGTGRLEGVVTEAAVFRAYERSLHAEQEHPG